MKFTTDIFKRTLTAIENKLSYSSNDINNPNYYHLSCAIKCEEVINSASLKESEHDEVRYVLAILQKVDYINIKDNTIDKITINGYKYIYETLYGVVFKY